MHELQTTLPIEYVLSEESADSPTHRDETTHEPEIHATYTRKNGETMIFEHSSALLAFGKFDGEILQPRLDATNAQKNTQKTKQPLSKPQAA